jgi:hypothetical protein
MVRCLKCACPVEASAGEGAVGVDLELRERIHATMHLLPRGEGAHGVYRTGTVIPQAFGLSKNNPTLKCVCDDCNGAFGAGIDLKFSFDLRNSR